MERYRLSATLLNLRKKWYIQGESLKLLQANIFETESDRTKVLEN